MNHTPSSARARCYPLALLLLATALAALGCPSPMAQSTPCTVGTYRCSANQPEVCAGVPSRWNPIGDEPCAGLCVYARGRTSCDAR